MQFTLRGRSGDGMSTTRCWSSSARNSVSFVSSRVSSVSIVVSVISEVSERERQSLGVRGMVSMRRV
jgi:hypothetical protein